MARMGRPPHFETPEKLWEAFEKYVTQCTEIVADGKGGVTSKPITVSGFCVYLGTYRAILSEYANKKEFSSTINKIYITIENDTEEGLLNNRYNAAGAIFNLKNNWKWKDKQETENINHNTNEKYEDFIARADASRKAAKQAKATEEEEV